MGLWFLSASLGNKTIRSSGRLEVYRAEKENGYYLEATKIAQLELTEPKISKAYEEITYWSKLSASSVLRENEVVSAGALEGSIRS